MLCTSPRPAMISYESDAQQGMIVNETIILEIVCPGTGLIRCRTARSARWSSPRSKSRLSDDPARHRGDAMSAVLAGVSLRAAARNMRIKGWMGRADQTTKVKGMFVHPAQVAGDQQAPSGACSASDMSSSARPNKDAMTLHCETAAAGPGPCRRGRRDARLGYQGSRRGEAFRRWSLPNDGKVIADERPVG